MRGVPFLGSEGGGAGTAFAGGAAAGGVSSEDESAFHGMRQASDFVLNVTSHHARIIMGILSAALPTFSALSWLSLVFLAAASAAHFAEFQICVLGISIFAILIVGQLY